MNTDNALAAVEQGIALADADGDDIEAKRRKEEAAQVSKRLDSISKAREFDKEARRQYVIDRRYARGVSAFEVAVNLIGTYIDIMCAFLYARDPDVSVRQAKRVQAPKLVPPKPPQLPTPEMIALTPDVQVKAIAELQEYIPQIEAYQAEVERRREEARQRKRFCETLEIIVSRLWDNADLKAQALRWVRSALTVGIGWLKVTWQERMGQDPIVVGQINDLKDNIDRAAALRESIAANDVADHDLAVAELKRQMYALQQQIEVVVSRGLAADFAAAEDITVSDGVTSVLEYKDAGWIDHRIFKRCSEAEAMFPRIRAKIKLATKYSQRKPKDDIGRYPEPLDDMGQPSVTAEEADTYKQTVPDSADTGNTYGEADFVCIHETWNKDTGLIETTIEGVNEWAIEPYPPNAPSSRFYPFFALAYIECDGNRHPQSLTMRSRKLQDEYNRTRSNFAEHRRRSLPGILFDKSLIEVEGANSLKNAIIGELIGLKSLNPDIPLGNLFTPKPVSPLDGALYTVDPIRRDLDDIWGVQQALQGATPTTNTATEAEIQQRGFGARTDSKRDRQDDVLTDLAQYTAEIAFLKLDNASAKAIAGEDAVWPQQQPSIEDLADMVEVKIRAGSTGKPDTASDRQAWAQTLPLVQAMVEKIGALRGASPDEIADKLEELTRITIERSGDSLDLDELIPQGNGLPAEIAQLLSGGAPANDPAAAPAGADGTPIPEVA